MIKAYIQETIHKNNNKNNRNVIYKNRKMIMIKKQLMIIMIKISLWVM